MRKPSHGNGPEFWIPIIEVSTAGSRLCGGTKVPHMRMFEGFEDDLIVDRSADRRAIFIENLDVVGQK